MVSKSSLACNQSLSSTTSSFDRILHNGLLDTACNKLFEFHCHEAGKSDVRLDSSARIIIVDYTTDIIKRLCDPSVPHSITEVRDRIEYSFPPKLRPSAQLIDEFCYLIDKGKKKATYLSADKVFTSF
ncbi:ras GTP exchange factor son of sevenless, partial [Clonorchis sinensis]